MTTCTHARSQAHTIEPADVAVAVGRPLVGVAVQRACLEQTGEIWHGLSLLSRGIILQYDLVNAAPLYFDASAINDMPLLA